MSVFMQEGSCIFVSSDTAKVVHHSLPVATYLVKHCSMRGFYLEVTDDFDVPDTLYGNVQKQADRILRTFADRNDNTGVMLTGVKGSGKTLLSRIVSKMGREVGYPTVIVNAPFHGDDFSTLLQNISQSCIVLFDEFEKVYDREHQPGLLTLLDGVFASKKLFMLTCNDRWRIDTNMQNRPGRIFYMFEFNGLTEDFIVEYCNDHLKDQTQTANVVVVSKLFDQFNFDMLQAVVEEMNRYNETAQEVLHVVNARPEYSANSKYTVTLSKDGTPIELSDGSKHWHGNPLTQTVEVYYPLSPELTSSPAHIRNSAISRDNHYDDNDIEWVCVTTEPADVRGIDAITGCLTFVDDKGHVVQMKRVEPKRSYSYTDAY